MAELSYLSAEKHNIGPKRWSGSFKGQWYRIMSMAALVVHTLIIPVSIILCIVIATIPIFWPVLGLYLLIIFLDTRPEQGAPMQWFQKWCRNWWWWKAFAYYFPITLHKTVDLEPSDPAVIESGWWSSLIPWSWPDAPALFFVWPFLLIWQVIFRFLGKRAPLLPATRGKKYLFGCHPHGIISMGAFCALATEGAGWSKLFPGLPVRLLTLAPNFYYPFYRQYIMALGVASVSKVSCTNLLNNNQNVCIVLGGARESLLAEPGRMDIILGDRKGFVKIALRSGASLVPVISFGENDIYEQVSFSPGSWVHKFHLFMTKYVGFTIPLFHARGIFDYSTGFIAYRRPINVVVGRPVDVELTPEPTQEQIDEVHTKYVRKLKQLWAENVNKYTPGVELNIIE